MEDYFIIKGVYTAETKAHCLQFDGLAAPNPGEGTAGAVLLLDGKVVAEIGDYIGESGITNNFAEYTGLLAGLQMAQALKVESVLIQGDSNLVVNQVAGKWKVENKDLKDLHAMVHSILVTFKFVGIKHVYREKNKLADALTNEVLKDKKDFMRTY
jgi:ribonuclease HI